jgi:hypothetical protein
MVLVTAAAVAFISRTFAPAGVVISVWFIEVPLSSLVWLFYLAGVFGIMLIAVGYASQLLKR